MEERFPGMIKMCKLYVCIQVKELKQNAERANIVGDAYDEIYNALKSTLSEHPRSTESKMSGKLDDLRSGKFEDAALGLRPFLKVPTDWDEAKECTIRVRNYSCENS
jgi:hypothetical protein